MSDVQRYDIDVCDGDSGNCNASMRPYPDGDWVAASDYDALTADLAEARGLLDVLVRGLDSHDDGTYSGGLRTSIYKANAFLDRTEGK
jgi:hypothetical protein